MHLTYTIEEEEEEKLKGEMYVKREEEILNNKKSLC